MQWERLEEDHGRKRSSWWMASQHRLLLLRVVASEELSSFFVLLGTTLLRWDVGTDFTGSRIHVLSNHGLEGCLHLAVLHIDWVSWAP